MTTLSAGAKRFLKGFLAGGLAQVVLIVGPGLHFATLADIRAIVTSLVFGFIVGGMLAVEKMLQTPTVPPDVTDNIVTPQA
jgi:hypothetical protein